MPQTSDFGSVLADARAKKGLSVRELAGKICKENGDGISFTYITDIEKGRGVPKDFILEQLAEALGGDLRRWKTLRDQARLSRAGRGR